MFCKLQKKKCFTIGAKREGIQEVVNAHLLILLPWLINWMMLAGKTETLF